MTRLLMLLLAIALVPDLVGADSGIHGRITRPDGVPIAGVTVRVKGSRLQALSGEDGRYALVPLPAATYALQFSDRRHTALEPHVEVISGSLTTVDKSFDWPVTVADSITVTAVSRRPQRIVDAPAAVSVTSEEEILAAAPTGQAPRMVENAPGVDFTQSGLYDFNFNVRGFNRSLNRRILTLIDGRDPSAPFLGAQEWAALSYPMDEFSSVELVRGPGSALYGANAYSGVLNMTTRTPRASQGGRLMLAAGELQTQRADVRHAGRVTENWYYRVVGGYQRSGDFTVSRRDGVEYAGLPRERVLRALDNVNVRFGGIRVDRDSANGNVLTLETAVASLSGPAFQTGIGRVQVTKVSRPWARINYSAGDANILAYYDARHADGQLSLASGAWLYEHSHNAYAEIQKNHSFLRGALRLVGGGGYKQQRVDSADPAGRQTLMARPESEVQKSLFTQTEFDVTPRLTVVAAARYDDSNRHTRQISPRGSAVFAINPNQTARLSFGRAFQRPNYSELFLHTPAASPVKLSAIETAFKPLLNGVGLGFDSIPVLALGNDKLRVEKVRSREIGYSTLIGGKLYVTADLYLSAMEDFVTNLLPGVNPDFPAYRVPAGVDAVTAAKIIATLRSQLPKSPVPLFSAMTNLPDGSPAFVLSSTNAGKVGTQGGEVSVNYFVRSRWAVDFNYSYFLFHVRDVALGDMLLPNAPRNKYNAGVTFYDARFNARVAYRWVERFPWASGVFRGDVPSYGVVNGFARWSATRSIGVGAEAVNLLDNPHRETFGGDILRRRALAFIDLHW